MCIEGGFFFSKSVSRDFTFIREMRVGIFWGFPERISTHCTFDCDQGRSAEKLRVFICVESLHSKQPREVF
jgi:hypothetical protein